MLSSMVVKGWRARFLFRFLCRRVNDATGWPWLSAKTFSVRQLHNSSQQFAFGVPLAQFGKGAHPTARQEGRDVPSLADVHRVDEDGRLGVRRACHRLGHVVASHARAGQVVIEKDQVVGLLPQRLDSSGAGAFEAQVVSGEHLAKELRAGGVVFDD